MTRKLSNNPPVILEIDQEMAQFILDNCEANIRLGMNSLQSLNAVEGSKDRRLAEKLVALMEKFRKLRKLTEEAKNAP